MSMVIQRLSSRVRSLASNSTQSYRSVPGFSPSTSSSSSSRSLFNASLNPRHCRHFSSCPWRSNSVSIFYSLTHRSLGFDSVGSSPFSLSMVQVRHVSSRDRRSKRRPTTPMVSKVKKIKIKPYSSYKLRFKTLKDGTIRRWKEGKRHNAHSKSKEAKRRLRRPGIVHPAFAKVMKRLNFSG